MITHDRRAVATPTTTPLGGAGWLGLGLAAMAAVFASLGGRAVGADDVDGYGIVFALPAVYWLGVVTAGIASGLLLLAAAAGHGRLAVAVPAVWLVVVHTSPALAHRWARFPIVYIHLGFIRLIEAEQTGDILLDARFAWPGFFGSFVPSLAEIDPDVLDWVVRLWPTLIMGASAVLVAALARRSYPNLPLIGPLSSLVFLLLSWTGQDYFSPQSVGFLMYLSIIIVLESGPLRPRGAWSSVAPILSRFATSGGDRPLARTSASYVALLVLGLGAIVMHPLAPFFICGALVILGIYGRTVAWRLLTMVAIAYVLWVVVAAEPWWSTRIDELTEQFGRFFTNLNESTSERVVTSSAPHLLVTRVRSVVGLATFVSVLLMGIVMATSRFRYLRPALPLAPLAGIPVLAAAVQSYGGEIIIRVLLFTLPMASILLARVLLAMPRVAVPVVVPLLAVVLVPVFVVARFGNEAFEMSTAADREAIEIGYAAADDDTVLVADNAFMPWGDRMRERIDHRYQTASPTNAWLDRVRADAADSRAGRVIVVFTSTQSAYREHVESDPPRVLDEVGAWLSAQPGVEVLYRNEGAWVFAFPAEP